MPIITTYYRNLFSKKRQVKERYVVDENGVKNGLYQSYHRNGQSSETCSFKNGIKHGFCVIKHDNGRVATECTYQDGCLEGEYTSYYADGHKRLECSFKMDKTHGTYRLFNHRGEIEVFYTYKNGMKHGPCEIRRYSDEVEKIQYKYDKMIRHERVINCFNSTTIKCLENAWTLEQTLSQRSPDGLLREKITYSEDGNHSVHEVYTSQDQETPAIKFVCTKGKKEGEYIRLGSFKLPIEISYYRKGELHGYRKLYFDLEKPVLKEESYYQFGKLDGLCVRYTPDGKVAEKCHYQMGKKVIIPQQIQIAFEKQADQDKRIEVSDSLIKLRRLGKRKEAMVVAQKFHLENSDIPRRTALKFNEQKTRV